MAARVNGCSALGWPPPQTASFVNDEGLPRSVRLCSTRVQQGLAESEAALTASADSMRAAFAREQPSYGCPRYLTVVS